MVVVRDQGASETLMATNAIEGGDRHSPAQALFRPAMTTFDSLPPDILLEVFRELDAIDLIRVGMVSSSPLSVAFGAREFHFETEQTCKGVYDITQDREVWAVQTFVMGRAKLCRRFNEGDKNLCFTTKGVAQPIPGRCDLILLPEGRSLLAINSKGGNMTFHRIRLEDGRASLPVAARIKLGERVPDGVSWRMLLTATSPCPILIHLIHLRSDKRVRHSSLIPPRAEPSGRSTHTVAESRRLGSTNQAAEEVLLYLGSESLSLTNLLMTHGSSQVLRPLVVALMRGD